MRDVVRGLGLPLLAAFLTVSFAAGPCAAERLFSEDDETEYGFSRDRPAQRAAWNAMLRKDGHGRVLAENRLKALAQACDMPLDLSMRSDSGRRARGALGMETFGGTRWQSIGPRPIQSVPLPNQTWGEVSDDGLPKAYVSAIVPASVDGRSVYVAFAGFLGTPSRHLFRTTDAGLSWSNVSGNLPDVPVTSFVIDPSDLNDLFVGTDVGVFRSVDGGARWVSFNDGLPNVSVYALAFHPATRDLYAATYGRGIFRIQAPPLAPVADFVSSPAKIYAGDPALLIDRSENAPTSWSWNFGDPSSGAADTSTAKNPEHTFAAPGDYDVTLVVTNTVGSNRVSRTVSVLPEGACVRCPRVSPFR